jgi:hypothetical protein
MAPARPRRPRAQGSGGLRGAGARVMLEGGMHVADEAPAATPAGHPVPAPSGRTGGEAGGAQLGDIGWIILQRLDEVGRGQEELRRGQAELRHEISLWRNWSLGLLLLAVIGLLVKLLLPGA